ncbi:MAG TPA: hypothetical protein VLT58_09720, partial [Polyangia bacterium]|nr:hypothetical protein [Polyangia bacterium]
LGRAIADALANGAGGTMAAALKGGAGVAAEGGPATPDPAEQEALLKLVLNLFTALPVDDWTTPDGRKNMGLENLMRIMFEHVSVGGQPVDMDTHFTGKNQDKYLVLWEALRHNFASFLGGVLSRSRPAEGKAA